jgi:hypothetical protein
VIGGLTDNMALVGAIHDCGHTGPFGLWTPHNISNNLEKSSAYSSRLIMNKIMQTYSPDEAVKEKTKPIMWNIYAISGN